MIRKRLSVWRSEYDSNTKKNYWGASSSKFRGGQSRDIFRGGQLKKSPCIRELRYMRKLYVPSDCEVPSSRPCWTLPSARAGPWAGSPCTARPPPSTSPSCSMSAAAPPGERKMKKIWKKKKLKRKKINWLFHIWKIDFRKTFINSSNTETSPLLFTHRERPRNSNQ